MSYRRKGALFRFPALHTNLYRMFSCPSHHQIMDPRYKSPFGTLIVPDVTEKDEGTFVVMHNNSLMLEVLILNILGENALNTLNYDHQQNNYIDVIK